MIKLNNYNLDNILKLVNSSTYYIDITNYQYANDIRLFRLLDNHFKEIAVIKYNTNNINSKSAYSKFKDSLANVTELFAHKIYK